MPRVQVNYPDLTFKEQQKKLRRESPDAPEAARLPWNESAVHVAWFPRVEDRTDVHGLGHIQIGFEVDVEYARLAIEHHNGSTEDRTLMYSPTLSPGEIDRMISALKRAKRKAFPVEK